MAKAARKTGYIAQANIDHGVIVDGKNVVYSFAPGDDVAIDDESVIEALLKGGALKKVAQDAPAAPVDDPQADKRRAEALQVYEATPRLKLQFASVDDYLASLDAK
jgi:hypothetical protein